MPLLFLERKTIHLLTLLFNQYKRTRIATNKKQNIFNAVYANALSAIRTGNYSEAINMFNSTRAEYPGISGAVSVSEYIAYCEIKAINFNDGNKHNLASIYEKVCSITSNTLKNELMNLAQMKTVMTLEGRWKGKYFSYTFSRGKWSYGLENSWSLVYYNGHYCTSFSNENRYDEIYNISENQFSFRVYINNGYMNQDTCMRVP